MIQISIVGKTNTGKSTFFKACTLADVEISNRSFTTIKPNTGVAFVRTKCACKDLPGNVSCGKCCDGIRFVPIKLYDVAGLIEGAHEGKGLGNQFLSEAMESRALIHVVDLAGCTAKDGLPVAPGSYDPQKDIDMLTNELDFWLVGLLKKDWKLLINKANNNDTFIAVIANRLAGLGILPEHVKLALEKVQEYFAQPPARWTDNDILDFTSKVRTASKPILIAGNKFDISTAKDNLKRLDNGIVPCSAEIELALREASMQSGIISYVPGNSSFTIKSDEVNEKQKKALDFIKKYLVENKNTGVQQCLDKIVFESLNMIVVYPVADEHKYTDKKGNVLPDAHLVPKGITAREFAYYIHEDIGKKFIAAVDCKKHQTIGANHPLSDGDIICIKAAK